MSSKKVEVVESGPNIVPVSQTHRVSTVEGSVLSAFETDKERRQDELKAVEDEILQESLAVLRGSLRFADIDFAAQAPDGEFYEKFRDEKDPDKLFRVIKAAQMKTSDAPIGLSIAQKTAIGIIKARAADKGKIQPLNVAVQIVTTMPKFEEQEVD